MKKFKNNISNIYPLAPMQAGMLFHFLKDETSQAYVQQISWLIEGHLDFSRFEGSWNELIRRHDILRTLFVYQNVDTPLQVVLEEQQLCVEVVDIGKLDVIKQQDFREDFKTQQRSHPFALDKEILLRVQILVLGKARCEVVLTHHHIIMDGWSLGTLVKESLDIYCGLLKNQQPQLTTAQPFRNYIGWLGRQNDEASKAFWQNYLTDYDIQALPPQIQFTQSDKIPLGKSEQSAVHLEMGEDLVEKLSLLAQTHKVTLNTVLQSIWGLLLCRYTNMSDVVFGAVVSGRPHDIANIESMVGIFINTIAVRVRLHDQMTVAELLQALQQDALDCEPHHHFPLAQVQAQTALRDRLLGSLFVMENYPLDDLFEEGSEILGTDFCVASMETWEDTHFDFGIRFLPDTLLKIKIGYNAALYGEGQMHRVGEHLLQTATKFADLGGSALLTDIDILTAQERQTITKTFNDTFNDAPQEKVLIELFEDQVRRDPNVTAVVFQGIRLSYGELNQKVEALALQLRHNFDIQPDDRIGLLLGRSQWTIVGILAVLKAGGAYVPMDTSFPEERLRFILKDSGCRVLLCDDETMPQAEILEFLPAVNITNDVEKCAPLPPVCVRPDHLAYIIYTSGSTGKPKGVMVEQHSVANLVFAMNQELYSRYDQRLNTMLITTYVFDGSVQQIFSALLLGHALFIMDDEIKRDTRRFTKFCIENKLDVAGCIPNFLALLHEAGELPALAGRLKHMVFGGEPLPRHLLAEVLKANPDLTVSNLYGPTECCVDATTYTVSNMPDNLPPIVPIGKPLANVEALILSPHNALAPLGVVGELCIAGAGVARGYLNHEALSQEKFVSHPFDQTKRMFRTGDMARWLDDGNIEFLGRNDQQVKIMGYRIEPGEIEEKLKDHDLVREVAVVPIQDNKGRTYLRACVSQHQDITSATLREYLLTVLPQHMVPARFMFLENLPTLVSGKIDRKSLMAMQDVREPENKNALGRAPKSQIEQSLLEVWRAVFGRQDIGVEDDYFSLGGDSIRAIQILSRLYREDLKIKIKDLFNHPTVEQLAPFVEKSAQKEDEVVTGNVPLTPVQKRFFAECTVTPEWFNHAIVLRANHGFEELSAQQALKITCEHHDAFRMRFYSNDHGEWSQEVRKSGPSLNFEIQDFRGRDKAQDDLIQYANKIHKSFDLSTGPLIKAVLFSTDDGDQMLIVVHHLVIDGVSWRILLEDFTAAYQDHINGKEIVLPAKSESIKRWGTHLIEYAQSDAVQKELVYWRALEKIKLPSFPVEINSPLNINRNLQTQTETLSDADTQSLLNDVHLAYGTSTEEILLVALARALRAWKDINQTVVLLEGHGREEVMKDININRTIGWFTSLYPALLELPLGDDIGHHIKTLKESLRSIPNKGIGYGVLKYLDPNQSGNGLTFAHEAKVIFNYMGQFETSSGSDLFTVSTDDTGDAINPDGQRSVELNISAMVLESKLDLSISFSEYRYGDTSIKQLLQLMTSEILILSFHCQDQTTTELTPSDLTSSDISLDELEDIFT